MSSVLTVGLAFATETLDGISPEALRPYLAQSGDENPLHRDPAFAAKAGLAGIPVPGQLIFAVMEGYAKDQTKGSVLLRITAQFVSPVIAAQPFDLSGRVVARNEAKGTSILRLQVHQHSRRAVLGEATVRVP